MKRVLFAAGTVLFCGFSFAAETRSAPVSIEANPADSLLWRTVKPGTRSLWWANPSGADSARLTVEGLCRTKSIDLAEGVESFAWTAPELSTEKDEDVYTFRLEFFKDGTLMSGETLEARGVGLVRGVGAQAETRVIANAEENSKWAKASGRKVVIPLWDETLVALSHDETPVEVPALPGWYGCVVQSGAATTLKVVTGAGTQVTSFAGGSDGLLLLVR